MYFALTRSSIRTCAARALLMFNIDVLPPTGIDEAIAEHINSLFLVGGKIAVIESNRHVWLFGPLTSTTVLLQTSLDPPFLLWALAQESSAYNCISASTPSALVKGAVTADHFFS